MVVNRTAKRIIYEKQSVKQVTKDVWIGLICAGLGETYYDDRVCAKYRRNEGSFSITETSFIGLQIARIKTMFIDGGFQEIHDVLVEFNERFGDQLTEDKHKELKFFANRKYNIFRNIRKIFYPHRLRYKISDEILLRILFLFGRV